MVRNHQDGYPYLNLHFFFVLEISCQGFLDCEGRGIARDIKINYFHFQTLQKRVTKLRQFTKLGPIFTFQEGDKNQEGEKSQERDKNQGYQKSRRRQKSRWRQK